MNNVHNNLFSTVQINLILKPDLDYLLSIFCKQTD